MISFQQGETCVYSIDITPLYEPVLFDTVYRSVSDERKSKTDGLRFLRDKCLSLGAEYLLMHALSEKGINYGSVHIIRDADSKPYIEGNPFFFNISHAGERAVCVLSSFPAGCDVERIRPIDLRIADRFFSPDEAGSVRMQATREEKERMFFRLWTLKESFIKCTGTGLRRPLGSFSVVFGPDGPLLRQPDDGNRYRLFEYGAEDGYQCALCLKYAGKEDALLENRIQWKRIAFEG